ncbi:MAG: translation elongation factor 4 [Patescibacteria group bacterium]
MSNNIRNFCIIAHIDHGKSTLADRLLEFTNTISPRLMRDQYLDQMDLERERGITIKLQPVRLNWQKFEFNLIDTPGHVDFTYEVSRSLAAVEGALILVDATQGVQAQTVANINLALEQKLVLIPIINKIDLANADVPRVTKEIVNLLKCKEEDILLVSAKTGQGVAAVLAAVRDRIPAPAIVTNEPTRALIFDSRYDSYRGVVVYIRIKGGEVNSNEEIKFIGADLSCQALEVGYLSPDFKKQEKLTDGEIGYIVTSLRAIDQAPVGDTITTQKHLTDSPLPGYRQVRPMVYAGIFTTDGEVEKLRESLAQLKLNDAALQYEPERSPALGFGFRCGFLGLLHMEIVQERLKREFDLPVLVTVPSVAYQVRKTDKTSQTIRSPEELPDATSLESIEEPWVKLDIITPNENVGPVMQLANDIHGEYENTEYISEGRAYLHYQAPLASLLTDFYDKLKSATAGYGSLNYDIIGFRPVDIIKLSILVAEEPVESLSRLVYRDQAYVIGRQMVKILAQQIPPAQFVIKVQAAIGGKIIAADRVKQVRKDVTAKLYGGDVTRKKKLLSKQKKGKARLKEMGKGKVKIPSAAYIAVLRGGND